MSKPITLSPSEYQRTGTVIKPLSEWETVVKEEQARNVTLLGPVLTGLATLIIGVGGFFYWASVTPIAQASGARGKVIVESNTKTVSHLEGGTLKSIEVAEGVRVSEDDLLATLDTTRSQSNLTQLRQQSFVLGLRLERLIAERDEKEAFSFTGEPPEGMEPEVARQMVNTEQKLFRERRSQFADQIAAERAMISQLDSQRVALIARREAWKEQLDVLERDFSVVSQLAEKQLATKASLNEKKIQLVDMETRIAESDAAIAENSQRRTQSELSLSNQRTDYFRLISEQIHDAQANTARVRQEIIAAQDVVAKSAIRAPQSGVVANIRIRTPGSAVIPGQPLLDIVPDNQPMVIEGRADASDIDSIHVGMPAEIKLTSFASAEKFPLIGHVTYIAPDGVTDESGNMFYVFRATISDDEMKKQPNLFLYPGMTADVSIINGYRTALAYLAEPIRKSFSKAFREQ